MLFPGNGILLRLPDNLVIAILAFRSTIHIFPQMRFNLAPSKDYAVLPSFCSRTEITKIPVTATARTNPAKNPKE